MKKTLNEEIEEYAKSINETDIEWLTAALSITAEEYWRAMLLDIGKELEFSPKKSSLKERIGIHLIKNMTLIDRIEKNCILTDNEEERILLKIVLFKSKNEIVQFDPLFKKISKKS